MITIEKVEGLEMQIYDAFKEIGADPSLLGYDYASWLIYNIVSGKFSKADKLTSMYEYTADHFDTTMSAVERNMRHMVGKIFITTSPVITYKYFGNANSLTTGQFIMSMVKYIKMQRSIQGSVTI